jgi:hypothetical protein
MANRSLHGYRVYGVAEKFARRYYSSTRGGAPAK